MKPNNVVARFRDGRILKGSSLNVDPNRPTCHLRTDDGEAVVIRLRDLKALFFVKDPGGNSAHQESFEATPGDARLVGAKRVAARFEDGETIVGMTNSWPPVGQLFFMVPIDPKSNNLRILVNLDAVTQIERVDTGTAASAAAPIVGKR
ncbi:MAG: DUF6982 domain-containing protein [Gemmatimonadales bacterium]